MVAKKRSKSSEAVRSARAGHPGSAGYPYPEGPAGLGEGDYYLLDSAHVDPARLKREREKARKLRKTQWWLERINRGLCHYCEKRFQASELTMDHVVPLARGGESTPGNLVPACKACNRDKKLDTPVDQLFRELELEKKKASGGAD